VELQGGISHVAEKSAGFRVRAAAHGIEPKRGSLTHSLHFSPQNRRKLANNFVLIFFSLPEVARTPAGRKMTVGMINANPVVHERPERAAHHAHAAAAALDALDVFGN
jgi:hypothetical protein